MVEWEDSAQPQPDWQWLKGYKAPSIIRCRSVGWLIHDDESVKALAPNISHPDDDGDVQASGIIRIPTRAVIGITDVG